MSFLHQSYADQFCERWASLNQTDWYKDCVDCSSDVEEEEDGDEPVPSVLTSHTYIAHIPWESCFAEDDQIREALTVSGFTGTNYFDLTNISIQSRLIELDQLASKCGVEGFDSAALEDEDENEGAPVILSSFDLKQLEAFKLAIELTGGI
jgi:hypothetical protein